MFSATGSAMFAPFLATVAQLDISGYLTGPDGRSLFANLVSSVFIQFINSILSLFFGTAA